MLEDVMSRLIEIGATYAPLSDRASTFGWTRWVKLCQKNNLKPLLGVELAVTNSINAKKPTFDYWTFFPKDDIACVNELVQLATSQFRYEACISYEQAATAPGVFKIVGNRAQLSEFLPHEDIFVALSPSCSKGYIADALARGHRLIASSDNKYVREEDEGFYEIVCGRGASTQTYAQHILSDEEWSKAIVKIDNDPDENAIIVNDAWMNALALSKRINAPLKKAKLLTADKPQTLEAMCREGAVTLGIDLNDPVYAERLKRELDLIALKEFEDYFYIIADVMKFARQKMICGPARGSSCGSLVCYLLNITTIDPIPYGLIFERFIDINRGGWKFSTNKNKELDEYGPFPPSVETCQG